eukprot:gnl/Dysnectes_brevis/1043_a1163_2195.p1 GENE.gnl/Dysnectes_brevis/1043_a1163_2195~~gnl/Dysnectes_brevis/1043_a1163_2195.p1  ORF type:complete len:395 (-),score=127.24 gnl/Dysnectes_brevis/1043_a1163_2195:53-1162(-)
MKALILVGGYGTRLRPLTLTQPKPLIPFCNRPIMEHQIEALAKVGVTEIILAVSYLPQAIEAIKEQWKTKFSLTDVHFSLETEPLGTGGPLALARDKNFLSPEDEQPFFMLNSDVICSFPFGEMLEAHTRNKAVGTILTTRVDDPSRFGVVVHNQDGCISRFVEKPKEFVGDQINAGVYLLSPEVLKPTDLPTTPTSIEREIFPRLAATGRLYCHTLTGYWQDVGKPADFLAGTALFLKQPDVELAQQEHHPEAELVQPVLVHPGARLERGCCVGPNVVVGRDCVLGEGCRVRDSTLLEGSRVGPHAYLSGTIVGWYSSTGAWSHVRRSTLGENVHVRPEVVVDRVAVLPHKMLREDTSGTADAPLIVM